MSGEDQWRQRMVDELYGDALTPGFARGESRVTVRASDRPGSTEFQARAVEVAAPAPAAARSKRLAWIVATAVAVALAAAVGWFAHGPAPQRVVYLPAASSGPVAPPPAAIAGQVPPAVPPAVPPTEAPRPIVSPGAPARATKASVVDKQPDTATAAPRNQHVGGGKASPGKPDKTAKAPAAVKPPARRRSPAVIRPAVAARPAARPQFACIPGSGGAAQLLCDNPALRQLDVRRQAAEARIASHGDAYLASLAVRGDKRFRRHRDKCSDEACLTGVFTARIAELEKLLPAGSATPPICMPGQYKRTPLMNCWPSHLRPFKPSFYSN